MKLTNPRIDIYFLSQSPEHGRAQTISNEYLVKDSLSITYQLLNGLKPSSNRVQASVIADCSAIEDIIRYEGDIRAVLMDGEDVWFTGFLSTDWNWKVTSTGMQVISLTIEDIGTRLLKRSFISTGCHLFDCTAQIAIKTVCDSVGIVVSPDCISVSDRIFKVVDAGTTCADILSQLLYELGYVYFFDSLGELRVFYVRADDNPSLTIDSSRLVGSGSSGISMKKTVRKHSKVKLSYSELGFVSDILVYRNTTGQDDTHPYCWMVLPSGSKFDGTETWTEDEFDDSTTREPALIEACNVGSDSVIGSKKIISIQNVRKVCTAMGSAPLSSISAEGGPYLSVLLENTTGYEVTISRLDAYADVVYEKTQCLVRAGTEDGETLNEELVYTHDAEIARSHAQTLLAYARNSAASYTFLLKGTVQPGTVVRLRENTHSGLEVTVLVYAVKVCDGQDVCSCSAVGISAFSVDDMFYFRHLSPAPNGLKGDKGNDGEAGGTGKSFFLTSSSLSYLRDLRSSGNQPDIFVSTQVTGYSGTPVIVSSKGSLVSGKLTIPYANNYDSITLTATLEGAPTQTLVLHVDDITEYGKYFGIGGADPSASAIKGDHYFNGNTGKIRYKTETSWEDLENAEIVDQKEYATILSNAMGDVLGSIEPGSLVSSYYGYFQLIIADIIKATSITVDAANITGKLDIANVDGGGVSLTKDGIGARSADGTSSWQINADGTATFRNASITGNLEAKRVTHDALKTIDALSGKAIGSSSMDPVVSKSLWNLDTVIEGLRNAFISQGHDYSGATINGVPVRFASFRSVTGLKVSAPAAGTSLELGNSYSNSVTISAGDSKDVVNKLVNNYPFPIWVTASVSLGGNMNGVYVRVFRTNGSYVQYKTDANAKTVLMPGEGINIHAHSSAWWGSRTAYGTIVCDISSGYSENMVPQSLFNTERTYSGGTADSTSTTKYLPVVGLTFESPSRYLGIAYQGTLSGICRKDGENYVDLAVKSSGNHFVIYDLGSEMSTVDLYYRSSVTVTEESWDDDDGEEHSSTSYNYTSITLGRFAWTTYRVLGTEPMVITDINGMEYRYSSEGYSGLYRADVISSLFGYTAEMTAYSGKRAYDAFISTLGVKPGTYNLNSASMVAINGSSLTSLTYMIVESDRITFENTSGSLTFFTTGDTGEELKSAYSDISAYVILMASTLGMETADIRPKANNTYSIGTESNFYSRGYFTNLYATTVNATTVYGAVFN